MKKKFEIECDSLYDIKKHNKRIASYGEIILKLQSEFYFLLSNVE